MDAYLELAAETAEKMNAPQNESVRIISAEIKERVLDVKGSFGDAPYERNPGRYYTFEISADLLQKSELCKQISKEIERCVRSLVKRAKVNPKKILVAGLGNINMIADALGTMVVNRLKVSAEKGSMLQAFCPSVYGITGIETFELLKGVADRVRPDLIIAVDTLACRSVERLYHVFQVTDAGLNPGAGVGNYRKKLTGNKLEYPLISIGTPLVSHAHIAAGSIRREGLIVTPKEIDIVVPVCADIIASAINNFSY